MASGYVVYDEATGRAVSFGTVVADPLPAGLACSEYDLPGVDQSHVTWDPASRRIVPRTVLSDPVASRIAFLMAKNRTSAETQELLTLLVSVAPSNVQQAAAGA